MLVPFNVMWCPVVVDTAGGIIPKPPTIRTAGFPSFDTTAAEVAGASSSFTLVAIVATAVRREKDWSVFVVASWSKAALQSESEPCVNCRSG